MTHSHTDSDIPQGTVTLMFDFANPEAPRVDDVNYDIREHLPAYRSSHHMMCELFEMGMAAEKPLNFLHLATEMFLATLTPVGDKIVVSGHFIDEPVMASTVCDTVSEAVALLHRMNATPPMANNYYAAVTQQVLDFLETHSEELLDAADLYRKSKKENIPQSSD